MNTLLFELISNGFWILLDQNDGISLCWQSLWGWLQLVFVGLAAAAS